MVRLFTQGVALGYFILPFQGGISPQCSCVQSDRRAAAGRAGELHWGARPYFASRGGSEGAMWQGA